MGELRGLSGIKKKAIDAVFIENEKEIEEILLSGKGATTAGENGAINIWMDDDKFIRCELNIYMRTMDSKKYKTFKEAQGWVKKMLVRINK